MSDSEQYWIDAYKKREAFWLYDGNPSRPHALLTSEKHSSGFFNSRPIIEDDELLSDAAFELLSLLNKQGQSFREVQSVVGPQTGATKLAKLISEHLANLTKHPCLWASPAKAGHDGEKFMVFDHKDLPFVTSRSVLLCEDVLTTGGSVELASAAVAKAGGVVLPFILVLVNRSGLTDVNGKKIIALVNKSMPIWAADECPLCKKGSEAVRLKDNWATLTAGH